MTGVKILTCCYCGARDAMRMAKGQRRTLACRSCGAPQQKFEIARMNGEPATRVSAPKPNPPKPRHPVPPSHLRKRRKKKRKSTFERIWDEVEDVFDIDDWFD